MRNKKMPYIIAAILILSTAGLTAGWAVNNRNRPAPKHYYEALYEQVFNEGFDITEKGCRDDYAVLWSKGELSTKLINEDYIDSESALVISNHTGKNQKLTILFDDFLRYKKSKGSSVEFCFYARKVSGISVFDITVQVDGASKKYNEKLESKWSCYNGIEVDLTENTKTMKIIIDVKPDQQFKLDEFIMLEI